MLPRARVEAPRSPPKSVHPGRPLHSLISRRQTAQHSLWFMSAPQLQRMSANLVSHPLQHLAEVKRALNINFVLCPPGREDVPKLRVLT